MSRWLTREFAARLAWLTALLVSAALSVGAQPAGDALDEYLQAQVADQRVPGLVFVRVDAEHEDIRTYGQGVTPQTRFYIGSLSKAMTAVAVMQLVDQGLIDLDAPIQAYIPAFTTQDAEKASRITVRHLLNQTSGLADQGYTRAHLRTQRRCADLPRRYDAPARRGYGLCAAVQPPTFALDIHQLPTDSLRHSGDFARE